MPWMRVVALPWSLHLTPTTLSRITCTCSHKTAIYSSELYDPYMLVCCADYLLQRNSRGRAIGVVYSSYPYHLTFPCFHSVFFFFFFQTGTSSCCAVTTPTWQTIRWRHRRPPLWLAKWRARKTSMLVSWPRYASFIEGGEYGPGFMFVSSIV